MGFLLAHLSDAHIGPLPKPRLRELAGKRLTGYVNWRRGRDRTHDMAALGAIVADLRAQRPDHVAMTGDVLNLALPAEFPPAVAWLETLGDAADVSFTPGNHDAYVRKASGRLASAFAPFTTGDDGVAAVFPYLRRRGRVALIGLSSGVPRAPFVASGRLGAEQCAGLATLLRRAREDGLARVVMIHHPPHRSGSRAG
ncbi:MAG: metallophosphoesterase, partial [Hyphomicrobiales bacterium]|nr:metallophosphoesterase [Hyphomicrobiales bacterium]